MQPPRVRDVVSRLKSEGWEHVRTEGDHRIFQKSGRVAVVPGKLHDHLDRGTYGSIKRQASWRK